MINLERDLLTKLPAAPDSVDSPELYQACISGLNVISELTGMPPEKVVRGLSEEAERLKKLQKVEKSAADLLISRLALLPTTLAYSGTNRNPSEIKQKAFEAISQISTARDRTSILR